MNLFQIVALVAAWSGSSLVSAYYPPPACESIVVLAEGNRRLENLVAALDAADLVDDLSGDGPFTVFAPKDGAFRDLGSTFDDLLLPENNGVSAVIHISPARSSRLEST